MAKDFERFAADIRQRILDEESDEAADAAWRAQVNRITSRHASIDFLEKLLSEDYDEFHRQGGSDRLIRLRQGDE